MYLQGDEQAMEVLVGGRLGEHYTSFISFYIHYFGTTPSHHLSSLQSPSQEWSSSFQQVLQCGLRRIIPADRFQVTSWPAEIYY
jgi:hypothetical protein